MDCPTESTELYLCRDTAKYKYICQKVALTKNNVLYHAANNWKILHGPVLV